jgi:DNA-binding Lrp family transcriptional regulator
LPKAYLMINTEIGSEPNVLETLKKLEGVEEAHSLFGIYDIIASLKADTVDRLKWLITKRIGKIEKISAKLTLVIPDA